MPVDEKTIPPPASPVTVQINLTILRFVFDWFCKKFLPAYKCQVTSEYRTKTHNTEVGGAENSAHVHGLAVDFILVYPQNNQPVPAIQAKKIFEEFVLPNWPGYALWEGDHIHLNLSREISTYAGIAGVALIGLVGYKILTSMGGGEHV